jgi:excisionase family DNA binding protein
MATLTEPSGPSLLGQALLDAIRQAVREEMQAVQNISTNGHASNGNNSELLTVEDLAKALKVPKSWLYDRTRRKKDSIPHIKVGRYPRFQFPQVLAWLESKKKT